MNPPKLATLLLLAGAAAAGVFQNPISDGTLKRAGLKKQPGKGDLERIAAAEAKRARRAERNRRNAEREGR